MTRRILFVTQTHNVWGGMEQWLHNFTLWLQSNTDWDVRVAMPRGRRFNDPDAYLREHAHMKPAVLDVRVGTPAVRMRKLADAIVRVDPDLVVPIATGDIFAAVAEAKRRGAKVRHLHPIRALVPDLLANVLDHWPEIDGVVSINRLFHRFFEEQLPADGERLHYVRHGTRPPFTPHDPSRFDDPAAPLRIGFVGRIEADVKRMFDLVPLVDALDRANVAVRVHLFGSGPAEGELRARLASSPLPVTFHGYQSQQELYTTAYPMLDVTLLFSESEGTPNAICEAMQHGVVPVISRYVGQAGERYVIHERNGLTFPVGDVGTAAAHIERLARDRGLLARLSQQARRDVESDTDVRMHRDWVAIFEQTLALPQKVARAAPLRHSAGRLDRILPAGASDALRALLGRRFPHPDGWAEWPGTEPAPRERRDAIRAEIERIDRDEQARVYGV